MNTVRITRSVALAVALAALTPAAAGARSLDFRAPDQADAGGVGAVESAASGDRRSPDARDAGQGRGTFSVPEVTVVKVPETSPPASSGIDLSDAVIGAGGALAVILLASAGAFAVAHRRRSISVVPTA